MGYSYIYQGLAIASNEELSDDALDAYANWGWRRYGTSLDHMTLTFDGDDVEVECIVSETRTHELPRLQGYVAKVI